MIWQERILLFEDRDIAGALRPMGSASPEMARLAEAASMINCKKMDQNQA